jgi:16S rRNA C967 or C1407 C5-methylase (RsmB/RsmF family)/NOL1/NOP2/fmu family ribosome biogenesis protein
MDFPEEFIKRINSQRGIDPGSLFESLKEPSPVSIRINHDRWNHQPLESENVQWCPEGWYLKKRPSFTLDPLFHSGCYYPQEASGMFVGEAFRQLMNGRSDIRVLDLCGAPGGKSTHLSSLIGNNGVLIANEVIRSRAAILAGSVTRWGKGNTMVTCSDPSSFSALTGYFDLILVDAPCSGEGMFRDQVAVSEWSASNANLCSARQKRIIMDVWPSLKKGGYMIYSTCTFNPAENEENIKWLLDNREGESIALNINAFSGIREIDIEGIKGYGFYPGKIKGEGFFLSVIAKSEESQPAEQVRARQSQASDLKEVKKIWQNVIKSGVPFIGRESDDVFAIPVTTDEFMMLRQRLNIIKKGTHIYQLKRDKAIPSHELAVSELLSSDSFPAIELDYDNALSFLRKENFKSDRAPEGWVIVKYQGVNMGFIKNIGTRINNYFPVGWRIRLSAGREDTNIIGWNNENN